MFLNFVIAVLISCTVISTETYKWKLKRSLSETFYNPYLAVEGELVDKMNAVWKKKIEKTDKIMMQAYYLEDNQYKFINYSLCGTFPKNSEEKLFQKLTYQLLTGKKSCPIKKGTIVLPSSFNMTTSIKGLPKCGKNTVKINGYRKNLPPKYFNHFLYVMLDITITEVSEDKERKMMDFLNPHEYLTPQETMIGNQYKMIDIHFVGENKQSLKIDPSD